MIVVTVAALTAPDVLPSSVFSTLAVMEVSLIVTASFPRPLIPLEPRAVLTTAAVPVKVATVAAFTAPVVLPSSVFNTDAANVVSDKVTASFPKPVIPPEA